MAGDWIKVEHVTSDKPEVYRMAMMLKIAPEHVTGCLVRVWAWADQQTLSGNAVCVTGVTLDRIACHAGFADAMKGVGWLEGDEMNFSLPNFDRHNGETAKTRALTNKRVKKSRNANAVTPVTQKSLPEKRREKKKDIGNLDGFAEWYAKYPKKVAKADAEKAWKKLKPDSSLRMVLLEKAGELAARGGDLKFTPNPASWLNGRRWEDTLLNNGYSYDLGENVL